MGGSKTAISGQPTGYDGSFKLGAGVRIGAARRGWRCIRGLKGGYHGKVKHMIDTSEEALRRLFGSCHCSEERLLRVSSKSM